MLSGLKKLFCAKALFGIMGTCCMVAVTGVFSTVNAKEGDDQGPLDVTIDGAEDLSPSEQVSWIREQTTVARQIFNRVKGMLEQARQEKDTLKITCLDDKLTQIHVSLRGIEERTKSLENSVSSGDRVTGNQNFAILKIYISRIFGLNSEAENCLGESDVVLGKTETTTTIDGDSTYDPDDPNEEIPDDIGTVQPNEVSGAS